MSSLENWMSELPNEIKDVPLIYLAIPGSHDSMTYGINRSSELAPDAEPILHRLYPVFRGTMIRWTVTQSLDALGQLRMGIRYLDLRLATKTGSYDFFFTHGLYAEEISESLRQVRSFVATHPGEVVILDFQHFYGFTADDHDRLVKVLLNMYSGGLVPRSHDLSLITLNSMERLRQQVIIVYRHHAVYSHPEFWQPQNLPSPWPQQENASGLIHFLENVKRHPGFGFVHQAVITPGKSTIVFRWRSTLREKCAVPVVERVLPRISELSPGPPRGAATSPVNVVIADFIELNDAIFPRTIIGLNRKLLQNRNPYNG